MNKGGIKMSEPFLGEVRLFSITYVPRGWVACEGQLLPINANQALFSLLGTTYGGDGRTTFALPDYRGRAPIGTSSTIPLGTSQGESTHALTINEMPTHTHQVSASSKTADQLFPTNNVWATSDNVYEPIGTVVQMNTNAISQTGSSQAHSNMQPYIALRFCIAIQGIYPSRN